MYDIETDPIFSEPSSGNEIALENSLAEEDKQEIPEASTEAVESTILSTVAETEEEQNKATYSEVFKSGGIRAVSGIPQGLMAFLEFNGAIDKGSTAQFTQDVLAAEKMGDMDFAQQLVRETLANAIPIAAEIAATKGVPLKQALARTAAVAPAGGYFSFIENPEQAAATSAMRLMNSGTALFLSTGFMTAGSLLGKSISALRGRGGEVEVAGPDILPETSARQTAAGTVEEAAERGVVLSPGSATLDPALVAQELKRGGNFSPEMMRFLADVVGSNAKSTQALIDDLINTIIPEGKSRISEVVGELYSKANVDLLPTEVVAKFRSNPVIQKIITTAQKDPARKAAYDAHPPNSIGRFNYVIKEVQEQIDALGGSDAAAHLIKLKKELQKAAKDASENYRLAVDGSQREKTAVEVVNALTKAGDGQVVPSLNNALDFVANFSNKKVKEQMAFGIRSLSDPKQRAEAFEKMNFLLKLIPKVSQMDKTLQKYLMGDSAEFAARGQAFQAMLYTISNFLGNKNSEAFVRFILDPQRTAARLKEMMPSSITKTEDVLRAFGLITGEILAEPAGSTFEVPFKQEDKTALNSTSNKKKAKTYEQLMNSGKLNEFMAKNPEAYAMLEDAYKQRAVA